MGLSCELQTSCALSGGKDPLQSIEHEAGSAPQAVWTGAPAGSRVGLFEMFRMPEGFKLTE
jgi:hypothetical protein